MNFFITEEDISKKCTRAAAVAPRLQELNTLCTIMVHSLLTPDVITQHTALVLTEPRLLSELIALDNLCRTNKVSFLYALTCGVSTSIFVDHSSFHVVNDPNGEKPVQKLITEVSKLSATELLVRYDHPAGQLPEAISSGAFEVTDVVGVSGINHQVFEVQRNHSDPVKTVRITIPPTISIDSFPYISGGMLTEKKIARPHPMASLEDKIKNPGSTWDEPQSLVLTDLLNIGSETQQHVAFVALLQYVSERVSQASTGNMYDLLPPVNNDTEAKKILEIAKKLLLPEGKITLDNFDLDEAFVLKYALYAGVELQPMSAFTGGVLAQEVVKCTGKFTPIPGFMHFSAFEVLPTEKPTVADTQPRGTRYDELAAVFGWPFIEKLGNLKYFMVGCGALGCEFVKNFALNGICCGPDGKLIVTDADRIELSNLTRQFLFREHNVGHLKSKAAGAMATKMNKHLNIEALEMFVGVNTENVFDDRFWLALDGVCNALDNMEARRYVDTMCVKYEKSLLESGTMGTSGNVGTYIYCVCLLFIVYVCLSSDIC